MKSLEFEKRQEALEFVGAYFNDGKFESDLKKLVSFKTESQNPENLKEKEIDRVNTHLKKNFEELEKFVDEATLSSSDTLVEPSIDNNNNTSEVDFIPFEEFQKSLEK